jgi:hypothetical protein
LLGELDLTMHRVGGLGEDRLVGRPAAAPDRAAASVEEPAGDTLIVGELDHAALRLVETPARGQNAAVLAGVRVPEHHFLLIPDAFSNAL